MAASSEETKKLGQLGYEPVSIENKCHVCECSRHGTFTDKIIEASPSPLNIGSNESIISGESLTQVNAARSSVSFSELTCEKSKEKKSYAFIRTGSIKGLTKTLKNAINRSSSLKREQSFEEDKHPVTNNEQKLVGLNKKIQQLMTKKIRSSGKMIGAKMRIYVPNENHLVANQLRIAAKRTRHLSKINFLERKGEDELNISSDNVEEKGEDYILNIDVKVVKFMLTVNKDDSKILEEDKGQEHDESESQLALWTGEGCQIGHLEMLRKMVQEQDASMLNKTETLPSVEYIKMGLLDIREGELLNVLGLYTEPRFLVKNAIGQYGLVKMSDLTLNMTNNQELVRTLMEKTAIESLFE